jgi:hypothetical protein
VVSGFLGDCDHAGKTGDAIGMFLKGLTPEIFRIVLLTDGEVNVGRCRILGEDEREAELDS